MIEIKITKQCPVCNRQYTDYENAMSIILHDKCLKCIDNDLLNIPITVQNYVKQELTSDLAIDQSLKGVFSEHILDVAYKASVKYGENEDNILRYIDKQLINVC